MGLNKVRIGSFVELYNKSCGISNLTVDDVSGVNKDKEFFEPSKQVGADTSKYKVVPPDYFACNLMHVGRDVVLPIALNRSKKNKIVSPAYTVFKIIDESVVLKEYFFIILNSEERDRYFWFHTDSSVRDGMSWDDFCNLCLELPDLSVQKKYVDVYEAVVSNQKCYENGLDDLKLACDAFFENAKNMNIVSLRDLIEEVDERNTTGIYTEEDVKGINNNKEFFETRADVSSVDLTKFKVVMPGEFAYNSRTDGRDMLVLALNRTKHPIIVTFNYDVFRIKNTRILPEYLYVYFKRSEFDRRVRFNSWGSSQELLSWESLCDFVIPLPSLSEQRAISNVMEIYKQRREINERLKERVKGLCPLLIRGSIEEGSR